MRKTAITFLIFLLLFLLFSFYVDREHLIINKKLTNLNWTESTFIMRFLKRKWQIVKITPNDELVLYNIDSSFFPKWFAKINFSPKKEPNSTHIISYAFKKNCTPGKKYSSGEVINHGSRIYFDCIPDNFIEYSFNGTGRRDLGINLGPYKANFLIDDDTKYLIQRSGKLNISLNEISCF